MYSTNRDVGGGIYRTHGGSLIAEAETLRLHKGIKSTARLRSVGFLVSASLWAFTALSLAAADTRAAVLPDGKALAGITHVQLDISGIPDEFARFGLTADEMSAKVRLKLIAAGLHMAQAGSPPAAASGTLRVSLYANEMQYGFYSYAVSVGFERKVPISPDGNSYIAHEVWRQGQHGVINPSDLKAIYGFAETLVGDFLKQHSKDNPGFKLPTD